MDATSKGKDDANYVTRDSSMLHVTKVNLIKLSFFFSCIKFTSVVLFSWIYRVKNSLFTLVPWSPIFFLNFQMQSKISQGRDRYTYVRLGTRGWGWGGLVSVKEEKHNHSNYLTFSMDIFRSVRVFSKSKRQSLLIKRRSKRARRRSHCHLTTVRRKPKQQSESVNHSWGHSVSEPPSPRFGAKSHFYGCTVTLPVTSSTSDQTTYKELPNKHHEVSRTF